METKNVTKISQRNQKPKTENVQYIYWQKR